MRTRSPRSLPLLLAAFVAAGVAGAATTASATSTAVRELPASAQTPRYQVQRPSRGDLPVVTGIRTARHAGFDRFVVTMTGSRSDHSVRYVRKLVADGSGATVPLGGQAVLAVTLLGAEAHAKGSATVPRVGNPNLPALRQWKVASDFEGQVEIGLGLADRVDFRVRELRSPHRLVIDVAHPLAPPTPTTPRTVPALTAPMEKARLTRVSTARHPGYDRTVFTFRGKAPGVDVRYVPRLIQDGSGHVLPLAGRAVLQVGFDPASSHDNSGKPTWTGPASSFPRLPAVRQVRSPATSRLTSPSGWVSRREARGSAWSAWRTPPGSPSTSPTERPTGAKHPLGCPGVPTAEGFVRLPYESLRVFADGTGALVFGRELVRGPAPPVPGVRGAPAACRCRVRSGAVARRRLVACGQAGTRRGLLPRNSTLGGVLHCGWSRSSSSPSKTR